MPGISQTEPGTTSGLCAHGAEEPDLQGHIRVFQGQNHTSRGYWGIWRERGFPIGQVRWPRLQPAFQQVLKY